MDEEALWVVRQGDAKVFLYGEGLPPRPPASWSSPRIEAAFDQSAVFWKETADAGPESAVYAAQRGVDPARPLSSWLTPKQRQRLAAAAGAVGVAPAALEAFRPWWVAQALMGNLMRRTGYASAIGAAHRLTAMAKAAGKPIHSEFPDPVAFVDHLAGLSVDAEVQCLLRSVDWIEDGVEMWERRGLALAAGDFRLETRIVRRVARAQPEIYREDVARNRGWTARFRAMLDRGGTTFVLVGADHLVGPDSLQTQLRAAGMRPRRA